MYILKKIHTYIYIFLFMHFPSIFLNMLIFGEL